MVQDPPALSSLRLLTVGLRKTSPKNVPPNGVERPMSCAIFPILEGFFIDSPYPMITVTVLSQRALRRLSHGLDLTLGVPYGKKRDTALKRADWVAFMERTVVIPRMAPVTNMFRFPSWLTDRSRLAAFSGVSEEGVVPDSIGTAPSGAWPVSALPWITLASPVRAPTPNRMSLARTRLRVCWSISLPESPSRPGNHVIAAVAKEATLMAL